MAPYIIGLFKFDSAFIWGIFCDLLVLLACLFHRHRLKLCGLWLDEKVMMIARERRRQKRREKVQQKLEELRHSELETAHSHLQGHHHHTADGSGTGSDDRQTLLGNVHGESE